MRNDPIIEEVRKSGEKIAASVGYDKKRFINRLRENQGTLKRRIVSFSKKNKASV
jgi:hypothetical protein